MTNNIRKSWDAARRKMSVFNDKWIDADVMTTQRASCDFPSPLGDAHSLDVVKRPTAFCNVDGVSLSTLRWKIADMISDAHATGLTNREWCELANSVVRSFTNHPRSVSWSEWDSFAPPYQRDDQHVSPSLHVYVDLSSSWNEEKYYISLRHTTTNGSHATIGTVRVFDWLEAMYIFAILSHVFN